MSARRSSKRPSAARPRPLPTDRPWQPDDMRPIEDLHHRVPCPPDPMPMGDDRETVEDLLGSSLAAADVELIESYGRGTFGDFATLLHPGPTDNDAMDMLIQYKRRSQMLHDLAGLEHISYLQDGHQLVPFLFTDNGDCFYWHRAPGAPAGPSGTGIVGHPGRPTADMADWYHRAGDAAEFVDLLVQGRAKVPFLPEDWPPEQVGFERY